MEAFFVWSGFAGGWLLVAGPVFQAAIEFSELDMEREGLTALAARYTPPPRDSAWWWLLPPVGYLLYLRRSRRVHREMVEIATPEQRRLVAQLGNKATAWTMVASAGLLLALGETRSLTRHYHWPVLAFWLLAVVMTALSATYTATRMRRVAGEDGRPGRAAAPAAARAAADAGGESPP